MEGQQIKEQPDIIQKQQTKANRNIIFNIILLFTQLAALALAIYLIILNKQLQHQFNNYTQRVYTAQESIKNINQQEILKISGSFQKNHFSLQQKNFTNTYRTNQEHPITNSFYYEDESSLFYSKKKLLYFYNETLGREYFLLEAETQIKCLFIKQDLIYLCQDKSIAIHYFRFYNTYSQLIQTKYFLNLVNPLSIYITQTHYAYFADDNTIKFCHINLHQSKYDTIRIQNKQIRYIYLKQGSLMYCLGSSIKSIRLDRWGEQSIKVQDDRQIMKFFVGNGDYVILFEKKVQVRYGGSIRIWNDTIEFSLGSKGLYIITSENQLKIP